MVTPSFTISNHDLYQHQLLLGLNFVFFLYFFWVGTLKKAPCMKRSSSCSSIRSREDLPGWLDGSMFWICRWYFLDLFVIFFGFVRDIFWFVCDVFWICLWCFLDFFGFLNNFYVFLNTIFGFLDNFFTFLSSSLPMTTSLRGSPGLSARRARRTKSSWPEGPPTRSWGPEGPLTSSNALLHFLPEVMFIINR